MNFEQARTKMVDNQVRPGGVTDHRLLAAMLEVPREVFFAETDQGFAYLDREYGLSVSQGSAPRFLASPAKQAKLIQLCQVTPDDIVLVIGAGGGYVASLFSRLASSVVGLEEDAPLAGNATQALNEVGCDNVVMLEGNHNEGLSREAPYDVIFVEGCVETIPEVWKEQLAEGGRLVVVKGTGAAARACVFTKRAGITGCTNHFNCSIPSLPGFEKKAEFAL